MSYHKKEIWMLLLFVGMLISCSSDETEKENQLEASADTSLTDDFCFFSSATAFLDSSYNVLVLLGEGNDIPVLPVEDSYHIFREKAALFIDARDPEEYQAGHIPGAVNIPYDRTRLPEYERIKSKLQKNERIVVYCNTHICSVSYTCAEDLIYLGFDRVIIAEGYMQWVEKGYPVEKFGP
ncbi:rhodanese-like domain-containing protein [Candidatus Zixiibacteriota bacterium]